MERILRTSAMRGWICERLRGVQQLDDGARPAVRHDERHGIGVTRPHVRELDVEPVDPGDELRHAIEPCLDLAPVVLRLPVTRDLLERGELHALRLVGDDLPVGPARGRQPPPQVDERRLGDLDAEWPDHVVAFRRARPCVRGNGRGRRSRYAEYA
jgi:hypothetical protein